MVELDYSCRLQLNPSVEVGPRVTLAPSRNLFSQARLEDGGGMAGGQMAGWTLKPGWVLRLMGSGPLAGLLSLFLQEPPACGQREEAGSCGEL